MDKIAIDYYKITGMYKHYPDEDPNTLAAPFGGDGIDTSEVAKEFFDIMFRDVKDSRQKIREIAEKQNKGADFLRTCITEALLCEDVFVRETAALIYKYDKDLEKEKKKQEDKKKRDKLRTEVGKLKKKYKESLREKRDT